jgi:hypothetical protein
MINAAKLRVGLALVTLVGAFHLHTASAAEVGKATSDCSDRAVAYGTGYCDGSTGGDWSWGIVWYTEGADGSCSVNSVECYS